MKCTKCDDGGIIYGRWHKGQYCECPVGEKKMKGAEKLTKPSPHEIAWSLAADVINATNNADWQNRRARFNNYIRSLMK